MVGVNRTLLTFSHIGKPHLFRAQGCKCFYCGRFVAEEKATRDHLRPRCEGYTLAANQVVACLRCNQAKAARRPTEREIAKARRLYVSLGVPAFVI